MLFRSLKCKKPWKNFGAVAKGVALAAVSGMICLLNGAHIVRRLCPVIKPRYDVAQICR